MPRKKSARERVKGVVVLIYTLSIAAVSVAILFRIVDPKSGIQTLGALGTLGGAGTMLDHYIKAPEPEKAQD